ncbi:MAG: hypothetical protein M0Q26_02250 [Chitinophagaceae bacterium]|nr:hypothetical protein [Chitinophagaceae bacterium]MDP1764857.1 hypothetical protein [Sediminibacterium sp.]MDP1810953.1 hypothetical protein [Sediminibacterium sp.]MDP3667117.1 hypothetical protein [Sediminibacterium sp.]
MKKVFAILAVAGFMAACNNGENKEAVVDSPKTAVEAIAVDSTVVDSPKTAIDTTKK